jgi:hypothetical protein
MRPQNVEDMVLEQVTGTQEKVLRLERKRGLI